MQCTELCTALCSVLHCALYCTELHCITMYCTLHWNALHHTASTAGITHKLLCCIAERPQVCVLVSIVLQSSLYISVQFVHFNTGCTDHSGLYSSVQTVQFSIVCTYQYRLYSLIKFVHIIMVCTTRPLPTETFSSGRSVSLLSKHTLIMSNQCPGAHDFH